MKGPLAFALFAVAMAAIAMLASGAGWVEASLPGGLPVGNALAALGLVAMSAIAVVLAGRVGRLRRVALVVFGAAVAWLPVSIALAGNLALNFGGLRGTLWLWFTVAIVIASVCTSAGALLARVLVRHG